MMLDDDDDADDSQMSEHWTRPIDGYKDNGSNDCEDLIRQQDNHQEYPVVWIPVHNMNATAFVSTIGCVSVVINYDNLSLLLAAW